MYRFGFGHEWRLFSYNTAIVSGGSSTASASYFRCESAHEIRVHLLVVVLTMNDSTLHATNAPLLTRGVDFQTLCHSTFTWFMVASYSCKLRWDAPITNPTSLANVSRFPSPIRAPAPRQSNMACGMTMYLITTILFCLFGAFIVCGCLTTICVFGGVNAGVL